MLQLNIVHKKNQCKLICTSLHLHIFCYSGNTSLALDILKKCSPNPRPTSSKKSKYLMSKLLGWLYMYVLCSDSYSKQRITDTIIYYYWFWRIYPGVRCESLHGNIWTDNYYLQGHKVIVIPYSIEFLRQENTHGCYDLKCLDTV